MEAAHHTRKYIEARGGMGTLAEAEKKALADMAKKGRRKNGVVDLRPTTHDSNAETG